MVALETEFGIQWAFLSFFTAHTVVLIPRTWVQIISLRSLSILPYQGLFFSLIFLSGCGLGFLLQQKRVSCPTKTGTP